MQYQGIEWAGAMHGFDKATATLLFQELGIEALPARVYELDERPDEGQLVDDFGPETPLVVRTAAPVEERNLPRVAGLTAGPAAGWIARLDPALAVIVQPFDDVVFSVEVAYNPAGGVVAEIVPGIWELDTTAVPVRVHVSADGRTFISEPAGDQSARFYSLTDGYTTRSTRVQGWQVTMTSRWVGTYVDALAAIGERVGGTYALKLHYASRWGLSPQNMRALGGLVDVGAEPVPADALPIMSAGDEIPAGTCSVLVELAVAREEAATVTAFAVAVVEAGVTDAWVRSGLLSHLAICLREAGLSVHQAWEGS